jgi:hypothetical protein
MPTPPGSEAVYEAAERWVDAALRLDDSLFTPGTAIWSAQVIDDLYHRFVEQPDEGQRSFEEKFRDQLAGAPANTMQLAAELLYVHFLVADDISGAHKRTLVDTVLSWSPDRVQIPTDLAAALEHGIAAVGVAFKTRRPFQLFYLLEFVKAWKALEETDREAFLIDPWAFKRFSFDLPARSAQSQRAALLNLVHPEAFEPITSEGTKKRIAAALSEYVQTDSPDVDRQLAEIRAALDEEYGRRFMFWDDDVRPRWSKTELVLPQAEVDNFADQLGTDEYANSERDYKVAIHYVLRELLAGDRLNSSRFPELLAAFFEDQLDLGLLNLSAEQQAFVADAVAPNHGVRNAFANLCGGRFGVNNFVWIPGAVRDGIG